MSELIASSAMIEAAEEVIHGQLGSSLPAFLSAADLAQMIYAAMTKARDSEIDEIFTELNSHEPQ